MPQMETRSPGLHTSTRSSSCGRPVSAPSAPRQRPVSAPPAPHQHPVSAAASASSGALQRFWRDAPHAIGHKKDGILNAQTTLFVCTTCRAGEAVVEGQPVPGARLAAALAQAGYVRINGKRITAPGQKVARGDVVTLALDRSVKVVQIEGFSEKRGAAPAAKALYRELTGGSGVDAGAKAAAGR